MSITIHPTWNALYGNISIEEYQTRLLPKILFKEEVHIDIKKTFDVIEKLLLHGYFEYEFLDVGIIKALHAFEMALKLRYEQLTAKKWNPKSPFEQLLRYFQTGNYFEINAPEFVNHVRKSRNALTHQERYGFGGYSGLHWIDTTVDLINDLYEDVSLRRERFHKAATVSKILNQLIIPGAIVKGPGVSHIVASMELIFTNNKAKPPIFTFAISPVFSDPDNISPPIILEIPETFFTLTEPEFRCFDGTQFEIKVNGISDETDKVNSANWNTNKIDEHFIAAQNFNAFQLQDVFTKARKKFHFQE